MKTLALAAPTMSLLLLAACGQAEMPTSSSGTKGIESYLSITSCAVAVGTIRCQALGHPYNVLPTTDVTDAATWIVVDSLSDFTATQSPAVSLTAPGVVVPIGTGKIAIYARMSYGVAQAAHTYAVARNATPIPLAPYVTGYVRETDGTTPIAEAVVEVIAGGGSTGAAATARVDGAYSLRDIVMNTPITVRVSKPGYVTETGVYQGFVDGATGYPVNTAQFNFRLKRAQ